MKPKLLSRVQLGKFGEDLAASYLSNHGFRLVSRNFKARYGELDIIAVEKQTLVFIEVKTRENDSYGTPEEAVTPRKLHEVMVTAEFYKQLHPELPELLRIDVIGIQIDPQSGNVLHFNHIRNVTG